MLKSVRMIAAFVVALLGASAAMGQPLRWQEGQHYVELDVPVRTESAEGVEVAEIFWYGCPHCYSFKPLIENWSEDLPEDINYVQIPAALGASWVPHAKAFYALEVMGERDKVHDALFDALAGERRPLNTGEALAEFVSGYGVDGGEFLKNYNSFAVNTLMQKAQAKVRDARVSGTPTVLVNGKYRVTATMAGGQQAMIEVMDYLISLERSGGQ